MTALHKKVQTLGELKESGWESIPVKEEIRRNLIDKMKNGDTLFPGVLGYDYSVIPQIQHALLARHDLVLLGLRGQAKTKILRMMVSFLDEYLPIVAESEINDDPFNPLSKYARDLIEEKGDDTPIEWIHRSQRYGEKLATPDTTVADLIGDIDPIKAASKRLTLGDENVINFGLIPRVNRGLFVINELPDLQPRIQVALLNIMQERDIQIRGFNVRIPLDVSMAFSANPEDYTNRGNIITPLKDRIDSQIITHYPRELSTGMEITDQEAWIEREGEVQVRIPGIMREIIEQVAFEARDSEYIDQKSGVSTRVTISAMEEVISSSERRAISNGESSATVRVSDLYHMVPALTGKLELVYEGEQEGAQNVAYYVIGKAVDTIFKRHFTAPKRKSSEEDQVYGDIMSWFANGNTIDIDDQLKEADYRKALDLVKGLKDLVENQVDADDEAEIFILMELVLEALHQNSMLGKEDLDQKRSYKDMVGSMLGSIDDMDDYGDMEDDE